MRTPPPPVPPRLPGRVCCSVKRPKDTPLLAHVRALAIGGIPRDAIVAELSGNKPPPPGPRMLRWLRTRCTARSYLDLIQEGLL